MARMSLMNLAQEFEEIARGAGGLADDCHHSRDYRTQAVATLLEVLADRMKHVAFHLHNLLKTKEANGAPLQTRDLAGQPTEVLEGGREDP